MECSGLLHNDIIQNFFFMKIYRKKMSNVKEYTAPRKDIILVVKNIIL